MKTSMLLSALCGALPLASANFLLQVSGGTPVDGQYIAMSLVYEVPQLTVVPNSENATIHEINSSNQLVDVATGNVVTQVPDSSIQGTTDIQYLFYQSASSGNTILNAALEDNQLVFSQAADPGYFAQWCELQLNQWPGYNPQVTYPGWVVFYSSVWTTLPCTRLTLNVVDV